MKPGSRVMRRIAIAVSALAFCAAAAADVREFNIPEGDLKAALDAYVKQSGRQLVYRETDIKGLPSRGVKGSLDDDKALERLLEGTGLKIRREAGAIALVLASASMSEDEAVPALQRVVVTGVSHLAAQSRTATRTDTDPMLLPQTVNTVSNELMLDQQARNLSDVLLNVAGVTAGGAYGGYDIRGFHAGVMRNGNLDFKNNTSSNDLPQLGIERVEVVKGPEAIIAGINAGYGGVINVVMKAPVASRVRNLQATLGQDGLWDLGADLGGALTEDKRFSGRVVVERSGAGHDRLGYDGNRRQYFAPSLRWENRDTATDITLAHEYAYRRTKPMWSTYTNQPFLSGNLPVVQLEPSSDHSQSRSNATTLTVRQRIVDGWTLGLNLKSQREADDSIGAGAPLPFLIPAFNKPSASCPGGMFSFPCGLQIYAKSHYENSADSFKLDLEGKFDTGPVKHKLLVAFDADRNKTTGSNYRTSVSSINTEQGYPSGAMDASSAVPVFGPYPTLIAGTDFSSRERGVLASDQLTWGDWVALVGWRQIHFERPVPAQPSLGVGLPMAGVVFRWTPELSLYTSASKGFSPNFGLLGIDGQPLVPEHSKQHEIGVKAALEDGLEVTAAVYQIKQMDVARYGGKAPSGKTYYVTNPGVVSKGFETDVSGKLTQNLSLRASYAYEDYKNFDGTRGAYHARNHASLWAKYDLGSFWVGGGLSGRSGVVYPFSTPTVRVPGQGRVDLAAGYAASNWSVVAGVKNVADKRLYTTDSGGGGVGYLEQPRSFSVTGNLRW